MLTWKVSGWERGGVPRVRETESDSPSSPRSSRPLTSASSRGGPQLVHVHLCHLPRPPTHVPTCPTCPPAPPYLKSTAADSSQWCLTCSPSKRENCSTEDPRKCARKSRAHWRCVEGGRKKKVRASLNWSPSPHSIITNYYLLDPVGLSTYVDLIMSVLKTPNLKFTWQLIPKSFWYHSWLTSCCFMYCNPLFVTLPSP